MGTSRAMAVAIFSESAFAAVKILRFTKRFSSFVRLNIRSAEECQFEFLLIIRSELGPRNSLSNSCSNVIKR